MDISSLTSGSLDVTSVVAQLMEVELKVTLSGTLIEVSAATAAGKCD